MTLSTESPSPGGSHTVNPEPTDSRCYWLALARTPGVGAVGMARLLADVRHPRELFESPPSGAALKQESLDWLRRPDWEIVRQDLAWLDADARHQLLCLDDPAYPALLKEIPDPPPVLFLHGDPSVLSRLQLAVVGSRNPTPVGERTAREFARHLAGAGLTISSGLASGIDAAAHQGALQGGGITLAVMGTGLDRVYPAGNRQLAHDIVAGGGLLLSEFAPGTPPRPENFPRRNRIISGLSLGTLVVEAAIRSGSLITARHALEQGREVFAIPGSIHNPLARGCHALIRQGAKLVETAEDVLEELGALALAGTLEKPSVNDNHQTITLDPEYIQLLDCMGYDSISVDELVESSGLTAEAVSSMLLILELENHVSASPGGRYCRITKRP